jgi:hypothetical protein
MAMLAHYKSLSSIFFQAKMKYFTLDYWKNHEDDTSDRYMHYLASVTQKLPEALQQFIEKVSLHDAQLLSFQIDGSNAMILFDSLQYAEDAGDHLHRLLTISYLGVCYVKSHADSEKAPGGPAGYGHLGFHEIELFGEGIIEHRLLFSSGIELAIGFADFCWIYREQAANLCGLGEPMK